MFRIGAHVSISDGFEVAVEHEVELGGNCGQIFVGAPRGWAVSDVDETETEAFRDAAAEQDVGPWIVHGTCLINLATPKDDLASKSIDCVQDELDAAAKLDIPYYVFHPGAHTGAGEESGIENVGERLSDVDVPSDVTLLLENMAGKGTTVGKRLEDLDEMVATSAYEYGDLGICLDTCHRPCLDAVQIGLQGLYPKNEIRERNTHGLILFTQQSNSPAPPRASKQGPCHLFAAGYDFTDESTMDELVEEVDDTDSDGACVTGPQPSSEGERETFPQCVAGPL